MCFRTLFGGMVVVANMYAGAVQASPIWTLTTHGKITNGVDNARMFETGSSNLTGLEYTQTLRASVDPSKYLMDTSSNMWQVGMYALEPQPFTVSMTVNGLTFTYQVTSPNYGYQYISAGTSRYPSSGYPDQIYSSQDGIDASGYGVAAYVNVYTYDAARAFVPTTDFGQKIVANFSDRVTSTANFYVAKDGLYSTYIVGNIVSIEVNTDISTDIPEPASIALLGIGMLGIAAWRRRACM